MAALNASSVAYTQLLKPRKDDSNFRTFEFKLVFGDGASTYPAGGIPLTAAKLGCPVQVRSLDLFSPSSGDGYLYKYDFVNNKIRIYQSPAIASAPSTAVALIEVTTAFVPVSNVTLYASVSGY